MGLMEFISTYLLDIAISIVVLAILIGSFFKPTQRYSRWLLGLTFAGLVVFLVKNVPFFNFAEFYVHQLFLTIKFESIIQTIYTFLGRAEWIGTSGYQTIYNLSMLATLGLVIFVITNLVIGISNTIKTKKLAKKGKYMYNNPFGSFALALLIVIISLVSVTVIASMNIGRNFTESSYILTFIYNNLVNLFNFINSIIPVVKPFDFYIDMIANIELGVY